AGDPLRRLDDTVRRWPAIRHSSSSEHKGKHGSLHGGSTPLYRASAAPWDFQPHGCFSSTTRWRSLGLHTHHTALGLPSALRPVQPVTLIRPHAARRAARFFVEKFPGRSLYAVKANPSPDLLKVLWESGVTHYDVASIAEVRLVAETL